MIDGAALGRIIAVVGREPDDRSQLARDIETAHYEYLLDKSFRGTAAAHTHRLVKRIRAGLVKSARLIKSSPLIKRATGDYDLAALIEALLELESWQAQPRKREGRKPSAIEFLAGLILPMIYDARFGPATDRKRLEFIETALAELKLARARETIITAMRHCAYDRKKWSWEKAPSLEDAVMPEIVRKALSGKK
jgi:hypothetical protein